VLPRGHSTPGARIPRRWPGPKRGCDNMTQLQRDLAE
jgi:hypothetical protein